MASPPPATDAPAPAPPRRGHACVVCDFPVAIFGRLTPCLHAFCLQCATTVPVCYLCNSPIAAVERVSDDALFMSPLTLQSFKTALDLERHTRDARARICNLPIHAGRRPGPPPALGPGPAPGGPPRAALPWRPGP